MVGISSARHVGLADRARSWASQRLQAQHEPRTTLGDEALRVAGALGIGASLMYVLDPLYGRRRRSLVRDQLTHFATVADQALGVTARDLTNRTRGLVARGRARLYPDQAGDDIVERRVRAKLGQYVSHPGSIGIVVHDGRVFLSGPILASEVDPLVAALSSVRGVKGIENRLDEHERPADISGLQGGVGRAGERAELMQSNWSPTARLLAGLAGGTAALWAAGRRGPLGVGLSLLGTGLLARAATNLELRRLVGVRAGRRAVDIEKTITVNAPLEMVWQYWRDYRYFPSFMSHVREVRDQGGGRSHWTVDGPAGSTVQWDARLTAEEPNRLIAWKTVPGSRVDHSGIVRLEPAGGATRVHLRMSYNPPAGALGHALAALVGADARRLMNDDLVRMKAFIETGQPPRDAAAPIASR